MDNEKIFSDEFLEGYTTTESFLSDAEVEAIELEGLSKEGAPGLKEKREGEVHLLKQFKSSPSQATFAPLYQSFKPLVMKAAQRNIYGSSIPRAAHEAFAAQSFLDAVRTWSPDKGGFNTHMFNAVANKGKRLNMKYQNIGYIPEGRATKYQAYQTALYLLREELGREPSTHELADEMALPVAEIERMSKEMRKTFVSDDRMVLKGPAFAQSDAVTRQAHDMMYSLIPSHQSVLEHILGLNGKPSLTKKSGGADIPAIAKQTGLNQNTVRSALKTISRKFRESRPQTGGPDTDVEEIFGGEVG